MTTFGGARIIPYIFTLIGSVLSGCGSPYEDISVLAAQSPGIGIEDVELMAFNAFMDQAGRGDTLSISFPTNLFLDPPISEREIRQKYLADRQGCGQNRTNGSFRCLMRVLVGRGVYDVAIEYQPQQSRMKVISFYALPAPGL